MQFINKSNPEKALEDAKKYLAELEEKYKHIPSFIATKPINITVKTNEPPLDQVFKKKLILKKNSIGKIWLVTAGCGMNYIPKNSVTR